MKVVFEEFLWHFNTPHASNCIRS